MNLKKIGMTTAIALSIAGASSAQMMDNSTYVPMNISTTVVMNTMGTTGNDVVDLQTLLETKGFLVMPNGVAKGYFGNLTKRALMRYQASVGLNAAGFFGPMTKAKMRAEFAMMNNNSSSMNSSTGVMVGGALMVPNLDIVDNAVNANNVTTVVAAVKAAGLVDTLKSTGPFTVFAPNNAAFAKLPAGTVETLLKAENKGNLASILTYHVVAGAYKSSDLTDGLVLKSVEGKYLKFTKVNGKLTINGVAHVETADVISKNGVTHVIDAVLLPPASVMVGGAAMVSNLDIVDNALNANNVTTVVAAVKAAGLVDTLKSKGPFTVFAPTNDAFNKLPAGTVETLLKPENKGTLSGILTYHVVSGSYKAADLYDGLTLTTVNGKSLRFTKVNGMIMINGSSQVQTADVISSNGVTFVIDTVLMP